MKTVRLKKSANGEIYLKSHHIEIHDKSSRTNWVIFKILPVIFIVFGIFQIYGAILSASIFPIILGLISGILLFSIGIHLYFPDFRRTNRKELPISEIKNVRLKKAFGRLFVDFKLSDKSTRRVYNLKDGTDWNLIKTYLTENNIAYSE